jgi:hypothetical protein
MSYRILVASLALGLLAAERAPAQTVATKMEPNPGTAITQVGTRGANFLRIGATARGRALGDAATAIADGAGGLFYNPAAAGLAHSFSVEGSWTDMFAGSGLTHTFVGAVLPVGAGAFGIQGIFFGSGEMLATSDLYPNGSDPALGDAVEWRSLAVGLTYGRSITDRLAVGITGKYAEEGISFAKASWTAVDVGLTFETGIYGVRLAMAVTNLGSEGRFEGPAVSGSVDRALRVYDDRVLGSPLRFRHDTETLQLPTNFRFALRTPLLGTASSILSGRTGGPHSLALMAELNDGFDTDMETRWGLEYTFREMLILRGGMYAMREDRGPWEGTDGLSGGLGLRLPLLGRAVGFDFAYTSMGVLENVKTMSFQIGGGR